jgi:hypothetical protein
MHAGRIARSILVFGAILGGIVLLRSAFAALGLPL